MKMLKKINISEQITYLILEKKCKRNLINI